MWCNVVQCGSWVPGVMWINAVQCGTSRGCECQSYDLNPEHAYNVLWRTADTVAAAQQPTAFNKSELIQNGLDIVPRMADVPMMHQRVGACLTGELHNNMRTSTNANTQKQLIAMQ